MRQAGRPGGTGAARLFSDERSHLNGAEAERGLDERSHLNGAEVEREEAERGGGAANGVRPDRPFLFLQERRPALPTVGVKIPQPELMPRPPDRQATRDAGTRFQRVKAPGKKILPGQEPGRLPRRHRDAKGIQGEADAQAPSFDVGLLPGPAGEKTLNHPVGRQGLEVGQFLGGKKGAGNSLPRHLRPDRFHVHPQRGVPRERMDYYVARMARVELETAVFLGQEGFSVGVVPQDDRAGVDAGVGRNQPADGPAAHQKAVSVLGEAKSPLPGRLRLIQKGPKLVFLTYCMGNADPPDVQVPGAERHGARGLFPNGRFLPNAPHWPPFLEPAIALSDVFGMWASGGLY